MTSERKLKPTHLDAKGLAARWHCRADTLRVWVFEGRIPPGFRIGKKRLWTIEEIEDYEKKIRKESHD